jgi:hypothetical protein
MGTEGTTGGALVHGNRLKEDALEVITWAILTTAISFLIRTEYDLTVWRKIGLQQSMELAKGYMLAFESMKRGKILP